MTLRTPPLRFGTSPGVTGDNMYMGVKYGLPWHLPTVHENIKSFSFELLLN
jgi:hypothetical protein